MSQCSLELAPKLTLDKCPVLAFALQGTEQLAQVSVQNGSQRDQVVDGDIVITNLMAFI